MCSHAPSLGILELYIIFFPFYYISDRRNYHIIPCSVINSTKLKLRMTTTMTDATMFISLYMGFNHIQMSPLGAYLRYFSFAVLLYDTFRTGTTY